MKDEARTLDMVCEVLCDLRVKVEEIQRDLDVVAAGLDEMFFHVSEARDADAANLAEEALKDDEMPSTEAVKAQEASHGAAPDAVPEEPQEHWPWPGKYWDEKKRIWVNEKPVYPDASGQFELDIW